MCKNSRRFAPIYNDSVLKEWGKIEKASITKPSVSAWSFLVVIVRSKDRKPRLCVYHRMLNRKMKPENWPRPNLKDEA